MVESYSQITPHGAIVVSVYPLELPSDLRGVRPYGALVPEQVSHRGPEMDTLTYKGHGGFNYPRESLPADFNSQMLKQLAESRGVITDDKAAEDFMRAVSRESALFAESIRQSRKSHTSEIGWGKRLLHMITGN